MAKKQESASLSESLSEYKELKDIDKETLINVLEESFRNVLTKMFGTDDSFDVIINPEKGDFEIWRTRTVVSDEYAKGENFNPIMEVSLTEAHKIDEEAEEGESVTDSVNFASFGRRAVLNLRQALSSKVLELQKGNLYKKFSERVGELISAEVYQVWKREALLIDDENNELLMPKTEQIPGDYFRKGDNVHAVIERVENENNNPRIILSRTSGEFLKRLLELNVPEIADGLITVKCVARVPGERAKIAVESYDDRIDPVGACVGMNGSRIRGIVRELKGENIDVIPYTANKLLFIQRALNPAKISAVNLNEEEHEAEVYMRPEEVPLAIGKNASNLKLASLLTGYRIEVFRDLENPIEEDIYLDEFSDEIESWVLDVLKNAGYTTAKPVLRQEREMLIKQTDLEESTIDNVLQVLRAEFEEDDNEEEGEPTEEVAEDESVNEEPQA